MVSVWAPQANRDIISPGFLATCSIDKFPVSGIAGPPKISGGGVHSIRNLFLTQVEILSLSEFLPSQAFTPLLAYSLRAFGGRYQVTA